MKSPTKLTFIVTALAVGAFAAGCSSGPYSYRSRANLDYWNAVNVSIAAVNQSRQSGAAAQLQTAETAIAELQRLSTANVDSELISLKQTTVNLFTSVRDYLLQNPAADVLPDPTDAPGYLHADEAALVDQGIQTRAVLSSRYRLEFPPIFDRRQQFRTQDVMLTRTPLGYRDPRISR